MALGTSLAWTPEASADVAIYGAPFELAWNNDVSMKLAAYAGVLGQIDVYDASMVTPTLVELQAYDAVLVYSDTGFANGIVLGDVLADYSDAGGGVVVAVFAYSISLGGRLVTDGYLPMTFAGQSQDVVHTLVIDDPTHRIMDNVMTFNGGTSSYHHAPVGLAPGGTLVASWNHGEPLVSVATPMVGRTVSINFYPPSSDARNDFWDASTDGALILANALWWASGVQCGDGFIEDMEVCDDGNMDNTDECLDTCVAASCGDGLVWAGMEDCDDGNMDNTDACLDTCVAASCGDGEIWAGMEDCDDGNMIDDDECRNDCTLPVGGESSSSGDDPSTGTSDTGGETDDGSSGSTGPGVGSGTGSGTGGSGTGGSGSGTGGSGTGTGGSGGGSGASSGGVVDGTGMTPVTTISGSDSGDSSSDSSGGQQGDDGGCACTTGSDPAVPPWLLFVFGLGLRRRLPGHRRRA
ncbi:MAG: DUF4215 domain-containing protein [Myxococcota bacterium]